MKIQFCTLIFSILFLACEKDKDHRILINDTLNGIWKLDAFNIDGNNQIGLWIDSSQMEFIKLTDISGRIIWTDYLDSEYTYVSEGGYEIIENGNAIAITEMYWADNFDLELSQNHFIMEGQVGSHLWDFEARRK